MKRIIALITLGMFALLGIAAFTLKKTNPAHKKLTVVCTSTMITDLVANIVGDCAQVKGLMGPGVDPHLYRARESDVHALAEADIIFYNGLHLEGKMSEILHAMNRYTRTVAVADALAPADLISSPEFQTMHDPHIWFDVSLWIKITAYVADALKLADPEHADIYQTNAQKYTEQLSDLHEYVMATTRTLPPARRMLVTAHDAFSYFGRAYAIEVVGLQGISTQTEPGTKDIEELVSMIVTRKIPAIFVESSVPERTIKAVQQAARARNWPVRIGGELFSDALGGPGSGGSTYIDMVRTNCDAIVTALTDSNNNE